ncbi:MAG: UDP-N-acetylglucosamine 1-carboxyvinyltransferase [Desulfobulbaceae bacterium]|nr:MAG: UDP-N-acetylglucosamine 1-carboxyvinyltransferase [Desulfobulbaceae bacterium]
MDKIVIEGGTPLRGEIAISGAKNAALPLICACLLAPGPHILENVPDLRDVRTMLALLEALGATWKRDGATLTIDTANLNSFEASYDLVKTMRASVLVLGPLLARLGRARVSLPGGCAIGARPINFHLQGFKRLGVSHQLEDGYVDAVVDGQMVGATICFDFPSVTATENILMGAVMARGETVIKNAAREPEIANLVDMLNGMGARIRGRGGDTLLIEGVTRLRSARIRIVPDRIETGTLLIAVGATGGELSLSNGDSTMLPALYAKLRAAGVRVREDQDRVHVAGNGVVRAVDIKTMPYPGFPTDLQAQMMALMCFGQGLSLITETIFENRFMHVAELRRMGADIRINGPSAIVSGVGKLRGARVMATDLRASASLVIAGLAAEGLTQISRVYHLDRGYDDLVGKLSRVGAKIHREAE